MPEQNQDQQVQDAMQNPDTQINLPHRSKAKTVWMILAILLFIALIAVSAFGYYKWKQYRTLVGNLGAEINALNNHVEDLNKQVATLAAQQVKTNSTTATSDDDQVVAAAKAYCEVKVEPSNGKAYVFTASSTALPNGSKKVVYANNKSFAEVSGKCSNPSGGEQSNLYTLKKSNNNWVVVSLGAPPSPEQIKDFAIPTSFQ